jgi:anti-anti-sigma factor
MTQFEIDKLTSDRYRLVGELDMASAKTLHEVLDPLARANHRLVLDLEDLTFIDSSGIRALLGLSERLNGAAPLVLSNVPTGIQRVLDIVGLESLPGIEVERGDG